ncbi:MAG: PEP-CTERM sorting domain-containing protein [Rhizobacter sp.]|nr:PEP-CTERM sorting domain-containing protein [Rhizobacter sp.]
MKVMMRAGAAAMLLAISGAVSAAQFVAVDTALGAHSVVNDTVSGTSWLNLNYTMGVSFNQVAMSLAIDPLYSNFRVATREEVNALFSDAGFSIGNIPRGNLADPTRLEAGRSFADAFVGWTREDGYESFLGLTTNLFTWPGLPAGVYQGWGSGVGVALNYTSAATSFDDSTAPYTDQGSPYWGTWLIARESTPYVASVPEPSTYAIFGLGLLAVMGAMRRRAAAMGG